MNSGFENSPRSIIGAGALGLMALHILKAVGGKGAVSLDGRLIDYASIRQAEVLVEKAKQIGGR